MMPISYNIDRINARLEITYGKEGGKPNWRIVFSNDQFENRYGEYEDRDASGNLIRRYTGWRMAPKYRQWIVDKWVLEMLVAVPPGTEELATKLSYEPAYGFPFRDGKPMEPSWEACVMLIEGINQKVGIKPGVRYKDPLSDPKDADNIKEQRLQNLEEELYGNETPTGDALAHGHGVGFTTSKEFGKPDRINRHDFPEHSGQKET